MSSSRERILEKALWILDTLESLEVDDTTWQTWQVVGSLIAHSDQGIGKLAEINGIAIGSWVCINSVQMDSGRRMAHVFGMN